MTAFVIESLRADIVGRDAAFATPFGPRHLFYADYTASGRALWMVEKRIAAILRSYANTHTEDDHTGSYMTRLLHEAEARIKRLVNAGPDGKIVPVGAGTTGALQRLQEMMGIYIPPVTRDRIYRTVERLSCESCSILEKIEEATPVVFVGPYEHHTNELMWREAFAKTVVIGLDAAGMIDLAALERALADPRWEGRVKIASFSAGSNITGVRTKVYDIARICHRHDAYIFFDFAAVAPYVEIDMNRDVDCYFDAIVFSPHKFIGGPGSCGILVFNKRIYRDDLPPTAAGGGTVDYVGYEYHDFTRDIETRETAGTPPILQTLRAALAMEVKERVGVATIERIEREHLRRFIDGLAAIPGAQLLGDIPADDRIAIVSFNLAHRDRILHPRFVTRLMNDLFGIQSRAGCSCAGPYGHQLLDIDNETSLKYRDLIRRGICGLKPGWVRINLHYTFTDADIDFLLAAIRFTAERGHEFLRDYHFDLTTAEWRHRKDRKREVACSLDAPSPRGKVNLKKLEELRMGYLAAAQSEADRLAALPAPVYRTDNAELEALKYFYY
ncbi:aminotransferase class V-fold PLP-dependent enzyme [Candidatus Fermentibacteria bacterium]|nr:aminotransferase class V-fold PLP-dependent enzyme [Candidatus Fermentibacteria bacterium]